MYTNKCVYIHIYIYIERERCGLNGGAAVSYRFASPFTCILNEGHSGVIPLRRSFDKLYIYM